MVFQGEAADAFGHKKLGGIGDLVSEKVKELSAKFNKGKKIDVVNQKLGYFVRCGDPDAIDSIAPMVYGNMALDLLLQKVSGRLVALKNGRYGNVPIDIITSTKKVVNVAAHYNTERLCPKFDNFVDKPMFIMTGDLER
jgi:6-phosphofructokinase 1